MKWPVLFIGIVLVAGVVIFAVSYGSPSERSVATSTTETITDVSTTTLHMGTGVTGAVHVRCGTDAPEKDCAPQIRVIGVYQGVPAVGLFKTEFDGSFRSELPPGRYELRVETASSTDCASVGIVVPEDGFVTADISCEVRAK